MRKQHCRLLGLVLLGLALIFVGVAVTHPEFSFPWSNGVTYSLYGLYVLVMVLCFAAPGAR